jgi:hypothetical protein
VKISEALIPKDFEEVGKRMEASRDSLGQQMQMQVLEPLIDPANPGAGGRARAMAANILKTFAPDKTTEDSWLGQLTKGLTQIDQNSANAMAEVAKLTLSIAGSSAEQTAGHNTGLGIVKLYQSAFPGLDTPKEAFRNMLHLFEVAHQAQIDFSNQSNEFHIRERHAPGVANGTAAYHSLNEFDTGWQNQAGIHAPAVYVAAAAILNGALPEQWQSSLADDAQRIEAIKIAMRANPDGTRAYVGPDGQKQLIPLRKQQ